MCTGLSSIKDHHIPFTLAFSYYFSVLGALQEHNQKGGCYYWVYVGGFCSQTGWQPFIVFEQLTQFYCYKTVPCLYMNMYAWSEVQTDQFSWLWSTSLSFNIQASQQNIWVITSVKLGSFSLPARKQTYYSYCLIDGRVILQFNTDPEQRQSLVFPILTRFCLFFRWEEREGI